MLPKTVETEFGKTSVVEVKSQLPKNRKSYLCPICEDEIKQGDKHVALVPAISPGNRRHVHEECLTTALERGWRIKLHDYSKPIKKRVRT